MLETLAFGDIEIERASDTFNADGKQYANGSYVIRMQQPFSGWAKTLLERQNYPDLQSVSGRAAQTAVRRDRADAAFADGR